MPGICLEATARKGKASVSLSSPASPWEMAQDSLQQDSERSLVILVIGYPGRDAKSFWCGTLTFKEEGHIFRVDDINRFHAAQLLPGGTDEKSYSRFQESQAGPGQEWYK